MDRTERSEGPRTCSEGPDPKGNAQKKRTTTAVLATITMTTPTGGNPVSSRKEQGPFESNLSIMFKDVDGPPSFDVGFLKSMDIGTIRYYKREWLGEAVPIDVLEKDLLKYINQAIEKNNLWDESILKNSEQTEIELP